MVKNRILAENSQLLGVASGDNDKSVQHFLLQLYNMKFVYYMHESQWLYPKRPAIGFDQNGPYRRNQNEAKFFSYVQFESMMAADSILWNSAYHMNTFLEAFGKDYIRNFRVKREDEHCIMDKIREKSRVLHVGMELRNRFGDLDALRQVHHESMKSRDCPIILWNMRWEYDKNPIAFVNALKLLKEKHNQSFQLIICGGHSFQSEEVEKKWFHDQLEVFKDNILHVGYADNSRYKELLAQSDIVVSTAIHEFFGIAVMEAIYCHTWCILPHDLSYPELIPQEYHSPCLYRVKGKKRKLEDLLLKAMTQWNQLPYDELRDKSRVKEFDWDRMAHEYDTFFRTLKTGDEANTGRKRKSEEACFSRNSKASEDR